MKLLRPLPLALGIALLLYRQRHFEKAITQRTEAFARGVSRAFEERDRQDVRWREELLREVERAFKGAARS